MESRPTRQQGRRFRYGLRRQLLLNLGLVVLVVWGLLSLVLTRAAYLRFMQERVRYILALSEQIDQITIWKYQGSHSTRGFQLWFQRNASNRKSVLWPTHGVLLLPNGSHHVLFGRQQHTRPHQDKVITKIKAWQASGGIFKLNQSKASNRQIVWERYRRLDIRGKPFGTLWLSWDLTPVRGEFFSYQGLLFFSLLLFGFLVLFLSMSFLERRLIKPLSRLGEAIQLLAEGQPGEDLNKEVSRSDEIGDLARAFVEMEQILQEQAAEREGHIEGLAEANAALALAQVELVQREKMATVGRLAAGVAHEVGNPLSAIMGYSDLLKGTKQWGDMEQDLVIRIRKETERIDRIIRDLLDYARPVTRIEPGDPQRAISEALELLRLQPRFKQMNVYTELPSQLPHVRLSEQYLVQVLINLLLNAADACEGKGEVHLTAQLFYRSESQESQASSPKRTKKQAPPQVTEDPASETQVPAEEQESAFTQEREPEGVSILLWDNGPGVEEELRERLFEPFVTSKAPGKGVGLGLALCHRWITESGGTIEVEEAPTGGALFRMELPVAL